MPPILTRCGRPQQSKADLSKFSMARPVQEPQRACQGAQELSITNNSLVREIRQESTVSERGGNSQELTRMMARPQRAKNSSPQPGRHTAAILAF